MRGRRRRGRRPRHLGVEVHHDGRPEVRAREDGVAALELGGDSRQGRGELRGRREGASRGHVEDLARGARGMPRRSQILALERQAHGLARTSRGVARGVAADDAAAHAPGRGAVREARAGDGVHAVAEVELGRARLPRAAQGEDGATRRVAHRLGRRGGVARVRALRRARGERERREEREAERRGGAHGRVPGTRNDRARVQRARIF